MSNLAELYDIALQDAKEEGLILSEKMELILDRKWAVSSDLENGLGAGGVLITGSNPSFDLAKEVPPFKLQYYSMSDACLNSKLQYWRLAKQLFYDNVRKHNIGFVDLFPIRCTDQNDFECFDSADPKKILKRNLLQVTQNAIESLSPKVIIHANKKSGYYWGTDKDNPWMGYDFGEISDSDLPNKERIASLLATNKGIDARIITGTSNSPLSIRKNKEEASILENHTIVIFYCQLGYQFISNERKLYDAAFFRELFDLIGVE